MSVDLTRWSHSRLDSYDGQYGCPRRWLLHYIHEEPEQEVDALKNGSAMHEAIRAYGVLCWRKKVFEFPSAIPAIAAKYIEDAATQKSFDWWAQDKYWDFRDWYGEASFELAQEVELPDGLGTWVQRIDWLRLVPSWRQPGSQAAIIRDWKSGWATTHKPTMYPPPQLQRYAWGAMRSMDEVEEVSLEIEYIGGDTVFPGMYAEDVQWVFGPAECGAVLKNDIVPAIERINANIALGDDPKQWPTRAGAQCSGCTYQHICPAAELAREYVYDPNPGKSVDAVTISSQRLRDIQAFHSAQGKSITKTLKARHEETGPILGSDGAVYDDYQGADVVSAKDLNALAQLLIDGKEDLAKHLQLKSGSGRSLSAGQKLLDDEHGRYTDHLETKPGSYRMAWKKPKEAGA